ncbi:hypothetical protein S2091_0601 [Solimicrobium silvestre]|uniref:Uncharacterized protein n=1 Tax=Solimicrobium silvestre TaxID=2099400 RepID=A0A2S9H3P8_9BURK|nr:hypothetical protein S2091_0601 [Solimicrobium silvestre]
MEGLTRKVRLAAALAEFITRPQADLKSAQGIRITKS